MFLKFLGFLLASMSTPLMAAAQGPSGFDLLQFAPLLVAFIVMYFFFIRTQRKKDAQRKDLMDSLAIGDTVILQSGLVGEINTFVDSHEIMLKLAPEVSVRCLKGAIMKKMEGKPLKGVRKAMKEKKPVKKKGPKDETIK